MLANFQAHYPKLKFALSAVRLSAPFIALYLLFPTQQDVIRFASFLDTQIQGKSNGSAPTAQITSHMVTTSGKLDPADKKS